MASKNTEKTPEQELQDKIRADQEYIIKNKRVRRQTRRRAIVIILLVFLLIIALLAGATYTIMRFVDESNFRVSVTQMGTQWLALSKSSDALSTEWKSVLDVSAPKNMDNCTLCGYLDDLLPQMIATDGTFGERGSEVYYIASTFYLKNAGSTDVRYNETITLERAMRNMDKAIRIILVKDTDIEDDKPGEIVAYAAYASDANGVTLYDANGAPIREAVVPDIEGGYDPRKISYYNGLTFDENDFDENGNWLAKPFVGDGYVHKSNYYPISPGQKIKYTVLIWLEGQDPQCVGDNDSLIDAERGILGGQVKLSVEFGTETETK